ncbi:PadR family transcriptional regulator [Demequina sp. NBRC 110053]|uniref:PadR family transcriptional regulator n=1 Tax=Demequina sp. NBRC 110053 TaxID=1570342 RepID=UPI0009FF3138|nr:PadR family transcriptional regulator [Demequina sp. NBRC 110053]
MLDQEIIAQQRQELRRGSTSLACLALLAAAPDYGYSLLARLAGLGLEIEANSLYPLLRRLEKQGLLTFEWDTSEARPRKVYTTSADGTALVAVLREDWDRITTALHQIGQHS